jgi:SAM-dependent methyltransferase
MYKEATERNGQLIEQGRVQLAFGDFIQVKTQAEDYDKIFCINVVYFWKDLVVPFRKIHSLLKAGGVFCFYMAHPDFIRKLNPADDMFSKHTIDQATAALGEAGFVQVGFPFNKGYYVSATKAKT